MFYSVRGKLIHKAQNFVVIECGGVGYRCYTSSATQNKLPDINSQTTLYTHLVVREDAMELYGFSTLNELECFEMLIAVSGVGAKMALAVLSVLSVEQFVMAVASSDTGAISKVNGVGKKKAERIILDLRDKIKAFDGSLPSAEFSSDGQGAGVLAGGNIAKAAEALGVLGYSTQEVMPLLNKMDGGLPVEKLISGVLKEMGRR